MDVRLMLVDDDSIALNALSQTLRRHLPVVLIESYTDPSAALLRLRDEPFAAVMTDFNMPGMNGITLLKAARENGSEAPFIVMTGEATDQILTDGLRLGRFALLNKPLSPATVVPLVRQAIECYCLRQEVAALRRTLIESGIGFGDLMHAAGVVLDEEAQPFLPF